MGDKGSDNPGFSGDVNKPKLPILPKEYFGDAVEDQARMAKNRRDLSKLVWQNDSDEEDEREANPEKYVKRLLKDLGYNPNEVNKVLSDYENPYMARLYDFVQSTFARSVEADAVLSKKKGYPVFVSKDVEIPELPEQYVDRGVVQALNYRSKIEKYLRRDTDGFDYELVCDLAASKKSKALDDYTYALATDRATTFTMRDQMLNELQNLIDEEVKNEDIDVALIYEDRKIIARDKFAKMMGFEKEENFSVAGDAEKDEDGDDHGDDNRVESESEDTGVSVTEIDPKNHEESEEEAERRAEEEAKWEKASQDWEKRESDMEQYRQENMKPEMERKAYLENLLDNIRQSGKQLTHEDYLVIGGEFDRAMYDFAMTHPELQSLVVAVNDVVNVYLQMGYDGDSTEVRQAYVAGTGVEEMFETFYSQAFDSYEGSEDASMVALFEYFEWLLDEKISFLSEEFAADEDYDDEYYGE